MNNKTGYIIITFLIAVIFGLLFVLYHAEHTDFESDTYSSEIIQTPMPVTSAEANNISETSSATSVTSTSVYTDAAAQTSTAELTVSFSSALSVSETTAVSINERLSAILEKGGYTENDISDSQQIITVESFASSCSVCLFEKNENWIQTGETNGFVGKYGVSAYSTEGDFCTPQGLFQLGFAFGTQPLDGLSVEYRMINDNCYWIDDSLSPLYNQWVESSEIFWNSAEHLADYPDSYKYSVVINYNTNPIVPYAGSAIFLHCSNGSYTAGCVSVPENDMLKILYWLNSSKNPIILIT